MTLLKTTIFLFTLMCSLPIMAVTETQKAAVRTALKVNDWDTAMDLTEDLVDDFPDSSVAHYLLASAIRVKMQEVSQVRAMFSLGDYKDALAKAIELDPRNIDARTEQIGFYLFAPGVAGGDMEFAVERIEELRKVDAFSALQMEAQLAAVNQDKLKQEQLLQAMLDMKPQNSQALMQLAVFRVQQERFTDADQLLLKINAEEDPAWPLAAQYQRAKWRILAKQDADLAVDLLQGYQQQLLDIHSEMDLPSEAAVYWRMALAYENKGDKHKAIELLEQSLTIDDGFEPAEEDLKRLSE